MPVRTEARPELTLKAPARPEPPVSLIDVRREKARRHHLDFMRLAWQKPSEPFVIGRHTSAICGRIDQALEDYRQGRSSFLICQVPFRHGKSDLLSRYLPPKHLGEFPDSEVMLITYAADLADDLSRFARRIVGSAQYQALFPGRQVAEESSAVNRWGIQGHVGGMVAAGFGGSMTGRGYALGIVDDYVKNRAEAESMTARDRVWDSFTNDFLTRRAPVSITIILATPWHVDDLIGRIKKRMQEDSSFPAFEILRFPAFSDDYPQGILFPERLPREWYEGQRAALGPYASAGLLQCDPTPRGGNTIAVDKLQYCDSSEVPAGLVWVRGWDLASSAKERKKTDPDSTAGALVGYSVERRGDLPDLERIWIADMRKKTVKAPERDRMIEEAARSDGPHIRTAIETVAGYIDTFERIQARLRGVRVVERIDVSRDLVERAAPLETMADGECITLLRGPWNQDLVDELSAFPFGVHDDQIAAILTGYEAARRHGTPAKAIPREKPITAGMRTARF